MCEGGWTRVWCSTLSVILAVVVGWGHVHSMSFMAAAVASVEVACVQRLGAPATGQGQPSWCRPLIKGAVDQPFVTSYLELTHPP